MAKKPAKKNKPDFSIEVKDLQPANNPKGGVTATSADQPGAIKGTDSSGLKVDVATIGSVKLR